MQFLPTLLLCMCSCLAFAQKEANIWYFGQNAGLDFNTNCQPTALDNSGIETQEASAVISNAKTGELLFYSDGFWVWNHEHQLMPNSGDGDPRPGVNREKNALSQGALIVPSPTDSAAYYLFTLTEVGVSDASGIPTGRLTYSLIDMRLDEGKGDVVLNKKNKLLSDGLVGRLTAIRHTNGSDYWIITHQSDNNVFLVFSLTKDGVGRADTVRIGSVISETYGFLKASPNGRKLACSSRGVSARPFDLFDFDPATGSISNHTNLGNLRVAYGVSFSPDNTKLYVSTMNTAAVEANEYYYDYIRQYDLSLGNASAITASGKSIIYGNSLTNIKLDEKRYSDFYAPSLQIGPDGRIYCASNGNSGLCTGCGYRFFVINRPNELGFACQVEVQTAQLGVGLVANASDLPNFMQHYFNGLEPRECSFDKNDECTDANVRIFPNPAKDVMEILITDICFTPYTLRIVNAAGQILASYEVNTPRSQQLHLGSLPGGIYFAELRFADRTTVKRFVKQ
ncbi:T9SS type A sorting domain-containing protein [Spirosoma soli]|uniref:T9SS type A sorting domain-containing protein n=1 Tax=Spirosoma soli TaxID=1770529 RepID=A0ABW5LYP5_9BACT